MDTDTSGTLQRVDLTLHDIHFRCDLNIPNHVFYIL